MLQNSLLPTQSVPGFFDQPNDDPDGGTFELAFVRPVGCLSVDLIDIDSGSSQAASVTLGDASGRVRVYSVPARWTEDVHSDGPPGW